MSDLEKVKQLADAIRPAIVEMRKHVMEYGRELKGDGKDWRAVKRSLKRRLEDAVVGNALLTGTDPTVEDALRSLIPLVLDEVEPTLYG